jgi:hypothetical protein
MDYFSRALIKAAGRHGVKAKQLWLTGTLSALAHDQLEASGGRFRSVPYRSSMLLNKNP